MALLLDGNFILFIVFLFLNLILCLKSIPEDFPVINIVCFLFTLIITVVVFLPSVNIPANPYLSAFLALLSLVQFLNSVLRIKV